MEYVPYALLVCYFLTVSLHQTAQGIAATTDEEGTNCKRQGRRRWAAHKVPLPGTEVENRPFT